MGKSTISMAISNSKLFVYQRVILSGHHQKNLVFAPILGANPAEGPSLSFLINLCWLVVEPYPSQK